MASELIPLEPIYGSLPAHWKFTTIGSLVDDGIAELQTGPFGTMLHASSYVEAGVPVIAVKHIGENRLIHIDLPRVDQATFTRLSKYSLDEGDIVFGRKGAVERSALVTRSEAGWLQGSDCIRLRFHSKAVLPQFISYVLSSPAHREWIARNAQGATMPSLNQEILRRIPVPLPPPDQQREIAHILGTLDDKIQLNRRMNATLEAIARAIFKSWFVDFDPVHAKARGEQPYGMDAETAALFPDSFENSELGPIPAGWGVKRFGEISEKPQYGYTASAQDVPVGPRFLRIKDINKAPWIEWANVPYCKLSESDHEKYKLHAGDIVIARMADPGHSAFIEDEVDAVFASYLIRFRSVDATLDRYLQFWLRSDSYWSQVEGTKTGTTRSSLNAQVLSSFRLVLPPVEIAAKFSDYVTALRQMIVRNNEEIRTLSVLRDALLPKLISGEIRIGDVESELTA